MSKNLSAIRATVRQVLRDELVSSSVDYEFADDELDIHIGEALTEISQVRPYEVKETLTTSKKEGTATATSASHLVDTSSAHFVAGDVGKTVYNSTDGTTAKVTAYNSASDLTLDTDIMASGESYCIYHYGGTSGKDLDISSITNLLEVAKAEYKTRQSPQEFRNVKVFGDVLTLDVDSEPDDGKEVFLYCHKVHELTEASSSLSPDLEKVLVEGGVAKAALAWLSEMRAQLVSARTTVDSISSSVGDMAARITQAVSDLTTGRSKIDDVRTNMDTAIDNMSARITQAIADLTAGRDLINKINIGHLPEDDYAQYATTELGNAARYLSQAQGYLAEATTSDRYANYAARELAAANAHLNKATGYARKLTAQINIAATVSRYQAWANNQYVMYQTNLRHLARPRVWEFYPRG